MIASEVLDAMLKSKASEKKQHNIVSQNRSDINISILKNEMSVLITKVELDDIDRKYPEIIVKINPENHKEAIRYITYAWESEKQHRGLIKEIKSGTGIFFNFLARKIEDTYADFVVCKNCGSTLMELPLESCPICGKSVAFYKKIELVDR